MASALNRNKHLWRRGRVVHPSSVRVVTELIVGTDRSEEVAQLVADHHESADVRRRRRHKKGRIRPVVSGLHATSPAAQWAPSKWPAAATRLGSTATPAMPARRNVIVALTSPAWSARFAVLTEPSRGSRGPATPARQRRSPPRPTLAATGHTSRDRCCTHARTRPRATHAAHPPGDRATSEERDPRSKPSPTASRQQRPCPQRRTESSPRSGPRSRASPATRSRARRVASAFDTVRRGGTKKESVPARPERTRLASHRIARSACPGRVSPSIGASGLLADRAPP